MIEFLLALSMVSTPLLTAMETQGESPSAKTLAPQGIVYTSVRPANQDLFLWEAGRDGVRPLTTYPGLDTHPVLSPGGRWVVFTSERDGASDLWVLDLLDQEKGGEPRPLTHGVPLADAATFSPDAKTIAFVSTRDGLAGIYVMPFRPGDATALDQATHLTPGVAAGGNFRPAFSPDGQRIAFVSNRHPDLPPGQWDGSHVYVMNADGSNPRRLTPREAEGEGEVEGESLIWRGSPVWSADGKEIVYQRAVYPPDGTFLASEVRLWRIAVDSTDSAAAPAATPVSPEGVWAAEPTMTPEGRLLYSARPGGHQGGPWQPWDEAGLVLEAGTSVRAISACAGKMVMQGDGPMGEMAMVEVPFGRWPFHSGAREIRALADRRLEMQGIGMPFPAPHPDGVHWVTSAFEVMVSQLDGAGLRPIFLPPQDGGGPPPPAWGSTSTAADGGWIAFSRGGMFAADDAPVEIWRVRADGSGLENLTPAAEGAVASNNAFPAYSPGGKRIVFRSGRDGNHEIYTMDADGQNPRRLTHHEARDTMPTFAPGGHQIAFVSDRDGDHEIYTLDLASDGTPRGKPRRITASPGFDTHPHYSPDGAWLVFSSERGGFVDQRPLDFFNPQPYGELFAVRLKDLHTVRLTHNIHEDGLAVWVAGPLEGPSDNARKLNHQKVGEGR